MDREETHYLCTERIECIVIHYRIDAPNQDTKTKEIEFQLCDKLT